MQAPVAAALLDALLGLELGATGPQADNRLAVAGLSIRPGPDGTREVGLRSVEALGLRFAAAGRVLEVGRLAVQDVVGHMRVEGGKPHWVALQAAAADLSGVKAQGPLVVARPAPAAGEAPAGSAWRLGPLATANGTVRAEIVDAHLLFDADVTVPIREGQVNFQEATVEHVGPDSRLGASRLGLYVDAPNGRSYLYQFASSPVPGVDYEKPSALPGPWMAHRGGLRLQQFVESLLRQGAGGHGMGVTEQARLLLERTAVSGEVRLGDGLFAGPGVQADTAGRAEGHNTVRLHSDAVGRGLSLAIASLAVRQAMVSVAGRRLVCDAMAGSVTLRLLVEGGQLRFEAEVPALQLQGLRVPAAAG